MVLGIDVVAGNGGLGCLPTVEGIELRDITAGRGCEKGVGIVDEFGVRRGVRESGGEDEGGGSQERRGEHGEWLEIEKFGRGSFKFDGDSLLPCNCC